MAKTSKASELLALVESAAESDLAEIDVEIAAVQKRLDGLAGVRKIIAEKLGLLPPHPMSRAGKAARKKDGVSSYGPIPSNDSEVVNKMLREIAMNGPDRVSALVKTIGCSAAAAYAAAKHPWFDVQPNGVHLSQAGWTAAKEKGIGSKATA